MNKSGRRLKNDETVLLPDLAHKKDTCGSKCNSRQHMHTSISGAYTSLM
jgi:hypothetical protein